MDKELYGHPHDMCPRCASTSTFWNDSNADPDNDGSYFHMYCEDCKKHYGSHHVPHYVSWEEEDE